MKQNGINNKVLVLAVHPDDETLGCGGTLLKHKSMGDEINWLLCTEVNTHNGFTHDQVIKKSEQIQKVQSKYNFDNTFNLELSTMKVDGYSMSELICLISKVMKEVQPNIIYLPFKADVHSDHRKLFEAAYSCTKVFRYPYIKKIYMMETLSETEFSVSMPASVFIPNVFVDISEFLEEKLEIMKIYENEIAEHPFPRSLKNIKALATFRGSTAGCEYAESFMLLKEIQ